MAQRTYRVTVRGRFEALDNATRGRLLSEAAERDMLVARFVDEGTLTYDQRIDAFQHRVVVRVDEGPGEEDVALTAGELAPWSTWRQQVSDTAACERPPPVSTT